MTDNEYAKHLFGILWNESGADCCSKCAFCLNPDELCRNLERRGAHPDKEVCFAGMRAYAEARGTDAAKEGAKL